MQDGLALGDDGKTRCWWCDSSDTYRSYHDLEWGRPVHDDQFLFENLCLEGFQAGLSWFTILKRRDGFRRAFHDFDIARVARMSDRDIERLMQDVSIIRNRAKIMATISNAESALNIQAKHGSLDNFIWQFAPKARKGRLNYSSLMEMTTTSESDALSKALKGEGFRFVGSTTMYAFMQSMGLVNDHLHGCDFAAI